MSTFSEHIFSEGQKSVMYPLSTSTEGQPLLKSTEIHSWLSLQESDLLKKRHESDLLKTPRTIRTPSEVMQTSTRGLASSVLLVEQENADLREQNAHLKEQLWAARMHKHADSTRIAELEGQVTQLKQQLRSEHEQRENEVSLLHMQLQREHEKQKSMLLARLENLQHHRRPAQQHEVDLVQYSMTLENQVAQLQMQIRRERIGRNSADRPDRDTIGWKSSPQALTTSRALKLKVKPERPMSAQGTRSLDQLGRDSHEFARSLVVRRRNTSAANELEQPRPSPHRTPRGEHVDLGGPEFARSIQVQAHPFSPSVAEATEQRRARGEHADLDRHELARSIALQRCGETYTF
jgi:hypothetical protein